MQVENMKTSLDPYLIRFKRRLRLRDGWLLAQRTLWISLAAVAAVLLAGRIWPVERLTLWAFLPPVIWLLAVIAYSLLRPMPLIQVARRADVELGLKERLSTGYILDAGGSHHSRMFASFEPDLVSRQKADAVETARLVDPRRAFPLLWLQRPLIAAALGLAAAGTLLYLPNPMDAVLDERRAVAEAADNQARELEELREEIAASQELTPEEQEELLRRLEELANQLRQNRGDREQALADLSRLEEALRRRTDPNAGARQAALEALAAQMQDLAGRQQ